ncbi:metallophosphatase family protein [Massilia buxea]|uniref:Metallophosphatase family protein n=3 Tax=Pseudoduganella buxea TaxID=1949069 RepID=A0A6I3SW98_9BURK|nr:metallophosphatase family protein [Pseudoduganella buxea]
MRIAHFSDLHYGHGTLDESDRCFRFAVETAIGRQVDLAVISGDSTHHALEAHSPALAALAVQVRRLLDHCPVLILQGTFSHEPPGTLSLFRFMGGRYQALVADHLEQVVLTQAREWVRSPGWRFDKVPPDAHLLCSCVPTLNKASLAAAVGAADAASVMGEHIATVLRGFSHANAWARSHGIPTIGVAHGTVNDCETEHGVPMAGLDHEFTANDLLAAGADAFMLGHIHLHQTWSRGRQLIAYPGSVGRNHYGERGDKVFLIWNLDTDGATFEAIPTPARTMTEFSFAGPPDMAELEAWTTTHDVAGTWVRIRWTYLEEEQSSIDRSRIEALFRGAANLKLEGRMVPLACTRATGITQHLTLEEKVQRWASIAEVDSAPLIAALDDLRRYDPAKIAQRLLLPSVSTPESAHRSLELDTPR